MAREMGCWVADGEVDPITGEKFANKMSADQKGNGGEEGEELFGTFPLLQLWLLLVRTCGESIGAGRRRGAEGRRVARDDPMAIGGISVEIL